MFRRFLPQETSFFDFFEQHSKLTIEACRELKEIANHDGDMNVHTARIKELEHQADKVTHQCIEALHRTFITPIDRADIHSLIKRLDDIIDSVDSAISRMALYEMSVMTPEFNSLADVLLKGTIAIDEAVHHLRDKKAGEKIKQKCIEIYGFENEGDAILRAALGRLFKEEKDPIMVIKWKEIYERLEKATDRCEQVANIIQGIVIEAS